MWESSILTKILHVIDDKVETEDAHAKVDTCKKLLALEKEMTLPVEMWLNWTYNFGKNAKWLPHCERKIVSSTFMGR